MSDLDGASPSPACPRCAVALFFGRVGALPAFGCGACGGLWLDNEATTVVLRRYDLDAAQLARMVDRNTAGAAAPSPFASAPGACPVCAKALETTDHQGTKLDFCPAHGTFFDRGELLRVLERSAVVHTPPPLGSTGPSLQELQTVVRHEAAFQRDPITTSLADWIHGGKDWVNGWRK